MPQPISGSNIGIGAKSRTLFRKVGNAKTIKFIIVLIAIVNILYISTLLVDERTSTTLTSKIKNHASYVFDNFYESDEEEAEVSDGTVFTDIPEANTVYSNNQNGQGSESIHKYDKKLYNIPNRPYDQLSTSDKILFKLNEITLDSKKYWLGHTELTDYELEIQVDDFVKSAWKEKQTIFYDPRFTLAIYINEIKNQYLKKNPDNEKHKSHEVVVPFAWSDWVDLTMLNEELSKPESQRKNCEYMKATHHIPAKDAEYCINNGAITNADLKEMNLPSTRFVPGFAVKKSPTNKASNEVRMLEGKSHLLTYAPNPLAIIFLTNDGVYEAQIEGKQRIVDSNLFEDFLTSTKNKDPKIIMNPVKEFNDLLASVKPNPLDPEDDEFGMVAKIKDKNPEHSKEVYLPQKAFNYQQDKIDSQLEEYETKMKTLHDLTTNELIFDHHAINKLKLTRNEKIYYEGLKYANKFELAKEPTYFRMARLNFQTEENDHDAGWHYEWRFFNGALRYLKKGWNEEELLIREKVLLDRILRNWFKFANEKGIISWIAHGPLLSWYWDGLLFPFDEDIDIQMPAEELTRFSKLYNQTLVVEDISEGFGKYFIDCSTFIHHRGKSYKENHIDARFIDIDTGSYIDITGLGISKEEAPDKYKDIVNQAAIFNQPKPVYNCRNLHFYSYDEISPLRYTMIGGVPCYIPNKVEDILKDEYTKGMSVYDFEGFYFIDPLNLWIHQQKLKFLFDQSHPHLFNDKEEVTNREEFTNLVKGMNEEQILSLLEHNEDILLEYYLTKDVTDLHKQELTYMFNMPDGENTKVENISGQKQQSEISNNVEYHKLTSRFKFQKPFRRPLFNYEKIDKPKHAKPSTE